MRARYFALPVIGCALLTAISAFAQRPSAGISAEEPGVGRLETHIQKFEQALGVVTALRRPLGAETECNGVCYFQSSSRGIAWRCAPREACDLHCNVNPPVGGCH